MQSNPIFMRTLHLIAAFLCVAFLSGCTGEVTRRWTEDVALEDGKVITIKRYVRFTESHSFAGDIHSSTDLESRISFTGELASLPDWREILVPLVIYQDHATREWVVVATTGSCDTWYNRGGPEPPYWESRLSHGSWIGSKLSKDSVGREANLFFDYGPELPRGKITTQQKAEHIKARDFATDYLKVIGDGRSNCQ